MTTQELMMRRKPTVAVPCGLEQLILRQITSARRLGQTAGRHAAELRRLESVLPKARELEALGETILSAVMQPKASDGLEIPEFLRRY